MKRYCREAHIDLSKVDIKQYEKSLREIYKLSNKKEYIAQLEDKLYILHRDCYHLANKPVVIVESYPIQPGKLIAKVKLVEDKISFMSGPDFIYVKVNGIVRDELTYDFMEDPDEFIHKISMRKNPFGHQNDQSKYINIYYSLILNSINEWREPIDFSFQWEISTWTWSSKPSHWLKRE